MEFNVVDVFDSQLRSPSVSVPSRSFMYCSNEVKPHGTDLLPIYMYSYPILLPVNIITDLALTNSPLTTIFR